MVTYFVTGTNRGIGSGLVKQLAADSEDFVFATVRTADNFKAITDLGFDNVMPLVLDMGGSLQSFEEAVKIVGEVKPEGVDVVINNAGICSERNIEHSSTQDLSTHMELYEINALGTVKLYRAISPYLFKTGKTVKKFVLISSIAACIGDMGKGFDAFGFNGYGMSKAAANYFVKQISNENAADEDEVVRSSVAFSVAPGTVVTDMTLEYRENGRFSEDSLITVEQCAQGILRVVKEADSTANGGFFNYDGTVFNY